MCYFKLNHGINLKKEQFFEIHSVSLYLNQSSENHINVHQMTCAVSILNQLSIYLSIICLMPSAINSKLYFTPVSYHNSICLMEFQFNIPCTKFPIYRLCNLITNIILQFVPFFKFIYKQMMQCDFLKKPGKQKYI